MANVKLSRMLTCIATGINTVQLLLLLLNYKAYCHQESTGELSIPLKHIPRKNVAISSLVQPNGNPRRRTTASELLPFVLPAMSSLPDLFKMYSISYLSIWNTTCNMHNVSKQVPAVVRWAGWRRRSVYGVLKMTLRWGGQVKSGVKGVKYLKF